MYVEIPLPRRAKGANPRLSTLHEVETIIRQASREEGVPLSLGEIGRRMNAKRTRPETIRAAVQELERHRLVAIGSKGVFWIAVDQSVWDRPTEPLA